MEHTELKKETSIDWLMTQLYKKGFIKEIDGNEPIILMNQAKEMEEQQQGYSEEDMKTAFNVGFQVGYNDETNTSYLTFEKWFDKYKIGKKEI